LATFRETDEFAERRDGFSFLMDLPLGAFSLAYLSYEHGGSKKDLRAVKRHQVSKSGFVPTDVPNDVAPETAGASGNFITTTVCTKHYDSLETGNLLQPFWPYLNNLCQSDFLYFS
jgi:hypothetical protein